MRTLKILHNPSFFRSSVLVYILHQFFANAMDIYFSLLVPSREHEQPAYIFNRSHIISLGSSVYVSLLRVSRRNSLFSEELPTSEYIVISFYKKKVIFSLYIILYSQLSILFFFFILFYNQQCDAYIAKEDKLIIRCFYISNISVKKCVVLYQLY